MKNNPPCHGCKYQHQDKNQPVCRDCDARYRYASGQVAETPIFDTKNDSEKESAVKTKTCEMCGKDKPANVENFDQASRPKDGLTRACKECRDAEAKIPPPGEPPWQKPEPEREASDTKECTGCGNTLPATVKYFHQATRNLGGLSAKCKEREALRKKKGRVSMALVLELAEFPEIMESLEVAAKRQMRTKEAQAMWIIKEALS